MACEAAPRPTIVTATLEDLPAIEALLRANGLPVDGLGDHVACVLVARHGGVLVGCAGVEIHGREGLLRSVVTAASNRGSGLGAELVDAALALARRRGVERAFLLTTTAEGYFQRFGFARTERSSLPVPLRSSAELRGACPESAVAMRRDLEP